MKKASIVAGLLAAILLFPTMREYVPRARPAIGGESITVMTHNLFGPNRTLGVIDEIESAPPDLLILQEVTPTARAALLRRLSDLYPYRHDFYMPNAHGASTWSRRPFKGSPRLADRTAWFPQSPLIRSVIEIDGHSVAVHNVHLPAPIAKNLVTQMFRDVGRLAKMLADETAPVILAGDFNFPQHTAPARLLGRSGLADAHDLAGSGRATTWPNSGLFSLWPSVRIDHIYLGGGLTASRCRIGDGGGSDHRPVIATVGFAP